MAAPASPVIRLDAAAVDPATVAYLRDLVERLEGKCYHLACDVQIAAAANADADLFRLRPEPFLLAGVPEVVVSAIDTLEELLRKGSPALAAYGRYVTRDVGERRHHQPPPRVRGQEGAAGRRGASQAADRRRDRRRGVRSGGHPREPLPRRRRALLADPAARERARERERAGDGAGQDGAVLRHPQLEPRGGQATRRGRGRRGRGHPRRRRQLARRRAGRPRRRRPLRGERERAP
uniref:Uncharacterized protein n=1 Tax=Oryza glaberrima TaxID=4538 RepID=I1R8X5_ORYGL